MKRPHIRTLLRLGITGFFVALLGFIFAILADAYDIVWLGKAGFVVTACAVVASGAVIFFGIVLYAYNAILGGLRSIKSLRNRGLSITINDAKKHYQDGDERKEPKSN